ncbi:glycerate kinase [Runella salmonicolor]|uniref:Glycerate kinase n=1 Tax=Runella salmonicolor TaxID=2950278 RepID=A0ABT1FSE2_9BACT|nr:glycerate kinase [Runella salmonicolor]MCP1384675.1 glycerate kinase [Runella salmonicolor]
MKFLLAPDKFRGSLTAYEVCQAMSDGIHEVIPEAEIVVLPMADGGEGTAEILTLNAGGKMHTAFVSDPLGRRIEAEYGLSADGQTAYIEMATASGLRLLHSDECNPLKTTTLGSGQLILEASEKGARHIILGIGGSATTDGGIGMAAALGWEFLDANGIALPPNGESLVKIQQIKPPQHLPEITVEVACDVTAPLFGPDGAAHVYAPQKGADAAMVAELELGLQHLAWVVKRDFDVDIAHVAGTGAAGGLGFGALFFLNAVLKEGVKIVMEQTHFESHLTDTDLVLTGEGKIDEQTLQGKLIAGIAGAAQKRDIPVAALCGALMVSPADLAHLGISYATSILPRPMSLQEAIPYAYEGVKNSTHYLVKLLNQVKK